MEYLSNLIAYKKYKRVINAKVVLKKEEVDEVIYNIDEAIRKTVLKGEDKIVVFGNGFIDSDYKSAWHNKYNSLIEIRTLFDYLDYHYRKQGFKTEIVKEDTVEFSRMRIKLKKVKEKYLQ